jgi:hypothetical protein
MERRQLKAMLEKAELRMFEGAWRIARQKELIAEMSTRGVDLSPYRSYWQGSRKLSVFMFNTCGG